ncbi:hypothetical protein Nepgr_004031 [Nepenthes gracilis]|uniref:Uncharacterized protein n=1 Tax=Nepenthes gracilis TaxID=150966 RepID=A0AAD3S0M6_NEPGR|nr:hypothetical protein Nepgr_004031 [Nepenthes gracilis]
MQLSSFTGHYRQTKANGILNANKDDILSDKRHCNPIRLMKCPRESPVIPKNSKSIGQVIAQPQSSHQIPTPAASKSAESI